MLKPDKNKIDVENSLNGIARNMDGYANRTTDTSVRLKCYDDVVVLFIYLMPGQ